MPLYLQLNRCMNQHGNDTWSRFDPVRSDSNYPTLFCSLQCEREWVSSCLAGVTLADVSDIQSRTRAAANTEIQTASAG
jgi:hypothetical protein